MEAQEPTARGLQGEAVSSSRPLRTRGLWLLTLQVLSPSCYLYICVCVSLSLCVL